MKANPSVVVPKFGRRCASRLRFSSSSPLSILVAGGLLSALMSGAVVTKGAPGDTLAGEGTAGASERPTIALIPNSQGLPPGGEEVMALLSSMLEQAGWKAWTPQSGAPAAPGGATESFRAAIAQGIRIALVYTLYRERRPSPGDGKIAFVLGLSIVEAATGRSIVANSVISDWVDKKKPEAVSAALGKVVLSSRKGILEGLDRSREDEKENGLHIIITVKNPPRDLDMKLFPRLREVCTKASIASTSSEKLSVYAQCKKSSEELLSVVQASLRAHFPAYSIEVESQGSTHLVLQAKAPREVGSGKGKKRPRK